VFVPGKSSLIIMLARRVQHPYSQILDLVERLATSELKSLVTLNISGLLIYSSKVLDASSLPFLNIRLG
jgi:transcription elongation factor GreA-like protein